MHPDLPEPITLFTQAGCSSSARVRACFRNSAVPFIERNVTGDPEAATALLATGCFVTPLAVAGQHQVVGANRALLTETFGFRCGCPDQSAPAGR